MPQGPPGQVYTTLTQLFLPLGKAKQPYILGVARLSRQCSELNDENSKKKVQQFIVDSLKGLKEIAEKD